MKVIQEGPGTLGETRPDGRYRVRDVVLHAAPQVLMSKRRFDEIETTVHLFNVMTAPPLRQRKKDDDKRHYHKLGLQAQNEPNAEPRAITAARAMTGPTIAAMTMSK